MRWRGACGSFLLRQTSKKSEELNASTRTGKTLKWMRLLRFEAKAVELPPLMR
jgi:hypothetical protein